jgi:DNA-directed RNA polymerase subunit M/transcription elongation factor TFIIS
VEFCEKCGALMLPKKEEGQKTPVLKCRECGYEKPIKTEPKYKVEYRIKHSPREKIVVVEDESRSFDELTEDEKRERRKEILEYYEAESDDE